MVEQPPLAIAVAAPATTNANPATGRYYENGTTTTYPSHEPPHATSATPTIDAGPHATIVIVNTNPPPSPPSTYQGTTSRGGCCGCAASGTPLCWGIAASTVGVMSILLIIIPYLKLTNCVDEIFDDYDYDWSYDDENQVGAAQNQGKLCNELIAPGLLMSIGTFSCVLSCIFGCCACCAIKNGGNGGSSGSMNNK